MEKDMRVTERRQMDDMESLKGKERKERKGR
jgi:hypothetical protein